MDALDSIDLRIIAELQKDARMTNQQLADRVGLSPSPCLRRVRKLEDEGVLVGYTAIVDQKSVGLGITAFVRITLSTHSRELVDEVENLIREIPEVIEAYLLAGDQDYLLKVVTPSLADYETLLRSRVRRIPSLSSIQTTFSFGVVKSRTPLPVV